MTRHRPFAKCSRGAASSLQILEPEPPPLLTRTDTQPSRGRSGPSSRSQHSHPPLPQTRAHTHNLHRRCDAPHAIQNHCTLTCRNNIHTARWCVRHPGGVCAVGNPPGNFPLVPLAEDLYPGAILSHVQLVPAPAPGLGSHCTDTMTAH